jgi:hypothetical protein
MTGAAPGPLSSAVAARAAGTLGEGLTRPSSGGCCAESPIVKNAPPLTTLILRSESSRSQLCVAMSLADLCGMTA